MIDQEVFRTEWAILCERFNREPSAVLSARYYQAINERLDTEAFRRVCQLLFIHNKFFPAPSEFWDTGGKGDSALADWEYCLRVMEGERDVLGRMSAEGQKTVGLMGGVARLGQTPLDSLPFVRREFLGFHAELTAANPHQTLQGPEVTPESRRIVDEVMKQTRKEPPHDS